MIKLLNFLESLYKTEYTFFSDTVQVLIKRNIEVDSYTSALCSTITLLHRIFLSVDCQELG